MLFPTILWVLSHLLTGEFLANKDFYPTFPKTSLVQIVSLFQAKAFIFYWSESNVFSSFIYTSTSSELYSLHEIFHGFAQQPEHSHILVKVGRLLSAVPNPSLAFPKTWDRTHQFTDWAGKGRCGWGKDKVKITRVPWPSCVRLCSKGKVPAQVCNKENTQNAFLTAVCPLPFQTPWELGTPDLCFTKRKGPKGCVK